MAELTKADICCLLFACYGDVVANSKYAKPRLVEMLKAKIELHPEAVLLSPAEETALLVDPTMNTESQNIMVAVAAASAVKMKLLQKNGDASKLMKAEICTLLYACYGVTVAESKCTKPKLVEMLAAKIWDNPEAVTVVPPAAAEAEAMTPVVLVAGLPPVEAVVTQMSSPAVEIGVLPPAAESAATLTPVTTPPVDEVVVVPPAPVEAAAVVPPAIEPVAIGRRRMLDCGNNNWFTSRLTSRKEQLHQQGVRM